MWEISEGVYFYTYIVQWCDKYNFILAEKELPVGVHIGMSIKPIQSGIVDYIRVLENNTPILHGDSELFKGKTFIKGNTVLVEKFDFSI